MADHVKIHPKLQQLHTCGFQGADLLQLVHADPAILTLSVSSLQRKWQYLTEEMGCGKQQVLQQCLTYFSKALVTEVGPRYSYVVLRRLQGAAIGQQQQQQKGCTQVIHLGQLLDTSIPEFLASLGHADAAAAADYAAHAQHWAQTEGLKWTAIRVA
jgi:hypothetical protein